MSAVKTSLKLMSSVVAAAGNGSRASLCRRCLSNATIATAATTTPNRPLTNSVRTAAAAAAIQHKRRQRPDHDARTLYGEFDRYNGVHVDLSLVDENNLDSFTRQLEETLGQWILDKRCSAWLHVPIEKSALIACAAKFGFRFHHAENNTAVLFLWMRPGVCKIHPYATHQVGVAGCIVNSDTREVLVVRDRGQQSSSWKFPGGISDLGEDIGDTAKREVFEETGLITDVRCQRRANIGTHWWTLEQNHSRRFIPPGMEAGEITKPFFRRLAGDRSVTPSEFAGILAFRQQHHLPGAFGRSDLFFICHMTPISYEIKPCAEEISVCRWIRLDELIDDSQSSALTKHVAQLAQRGLDDGFDGISIGFGERLSVYQNQRHNIYSRWLASFDNVNDEMYQHDAVDPLNDRLMNS